MQIAVTRLVDHRKAGEHFVLDLKPGEPQRRELPFPTRNVIAKRDHVDVIVIARHGPVEESVLGDAADDEHLRLQGEQHLEQGEVTSGVHEAFIRQNLLARNLDIRAVSGTAEPIRRTSDRPEGRPFGSGATDPTQAPSGRGRVSVR